MATKFKQLQERVQNYWAELDEGQRARHWLALTVLAVAAVGVPAWLFGPGAWRRWQQGKALAQVRVFSGENDYRSATLALRRALELGPNDPAAWQEAARVLGEIGSPEVLAAHEQVARLSPQDDAAKLALAKLALRYERFDLAEKALADVGPAVRTDAAFFRLTAAVAQALGRTEELEGLLAKAVAAAPGEAEARFNYAAVRLWSDSAEKRAVARTELLVMTEDRSVRIRAALELVKAAAREHDERVLNDTLAELLPRFVPGWRRDFPVAGMAGWTRLTESLKTAAAESGPEDVARLAHWLGDIEQRREALVWLEGLPEPIARAAPVTEVAAELSAELGDLDRLEGYLRNGAWGVWPRDALTLAIASRLQKLRYGEAQGRATWETALAAAGDSLPALRSMVRLAEAWGDVEGVKRTLHEIVERFPSTIWAYEALNTFYAGQRDLPRLWQLHEAWRKQRPDDDTVAIRWIVLGCILDRAGPELAARAEALHAKAPENAAATVALAALRWRQGKAGETVALLGQLPASERTKPGTALWAGLAYAELGHRKLAEAGLTAAWSGRLSPEEAALVRGAAGQVKIVLPGLGG